MRISDTTTANGPRLSSVISPSAPLGAVSMAYRFRSCRSNAARTFGSSSTKRIFSLTRYSRRYSPDFVTHSRPRVGRPVPISQDNPYPQGHLHPKPVLFRPRGQPSADRRGLPDRRWARGATPLLPQRGWATPKAQKIRAHLGVGRSKYLTFGAHDGQLFVVNQTKHLPILLRLLTDEREPADIVEKPHQSRVGGLRAAGFGLGNAPRQLRNFAAVIPEMIDRKRLNHSAVVAFEHIGNENERFGRLCSQRLHCLYWIRGGVS